MAATYLQRYNFISSDPDFLIRVLMAAVDMAIDINAEAPTSDDVLDAGRMSFARSVLIQPNHYSRLIANGVVVNDAAKSTMTDSELAAIVADIWNAYAGVKDTS